MKTWHLLVGALFAGVLGAVASRAIDGGWLGRTGPVQAALVTRARAGDAQAPLAGSQLPDLVLPDRRGTRTRLADLTRSRPALINLWASWCAPCIREMPALDAFARAQGANGVQVVGIALDTSDAVDRFLASHPVSYPVLLDSPGPADAGVRLGDVRGVLPYSVLVDARGRVLRQWVGPLQPDDLRALARESGATPTAD